MAEREAYDLESVYDEQIAPLMAQIIGICNEHGMSMFATFEYATGKYCTTSLPHDSGSLLLRLCQWSAIASNGTGVNVDAVIMALLRHAREHGHSSAMLSQLGVNTDGTERRRCSICGR